MFIPGECQLENNALEPAPAHELQRVPLQLGSQLDVALYWALLDFHIFPVNPRHRITPDGRCGVTVKAPLILDWPERSTNDPDKIREMWRENPEAAVGLDCGKSGLLVIDPDCHWGEADGLTAWRQLWTLLGETVPPVIVRTPSGGQHWWFAQLEGMRLGNSEGNLPAGVNVRGFGGLVLAPKSIIETGKAVRSGSGWAVRGADGSLLQPGEPVPLGRYDLVAGDLSAIPALPEWLVSMLKPKEGLKTSKPALALTPLDQKIEMLKLASALLHIPAGPRKTWAPVGMAIRWQLAEEGFRLWDDWSRTAPEKYHYDTNVEQWNSFHVPGDDGQADRLVVTLGTVYKLAEDHGWPGLKNLPELQREIAELKRKAQLAAVKPTKENAPACPQDGGAAPGGAEDWEEPEPLPNALLPVPAFDFGWLPAKLQPWARDIHERMQCPKDFIGVTIIIGLGTVIGRKVVIRPKEHDPDWCEAANLWGLLIGRPGMLKTPAMLAAMKPLARLEARAREKHAEALKLYNNKKIANEAKKKSGKSHIERLANEKPDMTTEQLADILGSSIDELETEPTTKRYTTNDVNPASLGKLLMQNPNGVMINRDELASLLESFNRDDMSALRSLIMSGWSGTGSHTLDRMDRGLDLHISAVCISVLGTTQPGKIAPYIREAVSEGNSDDGLMQRFQLGVWPDTPDSWKDVDEPGDLAQREEAFAVFKQLDEMDPAGWALQDTYGLPYLKFDAEALARFRAWRAELEKRLCSEELQSAFEVSLVKVSEARSVLCTDLSPGGRQPRTRGGGGAQKVYRVGDLPGSSRAADLQQRPDRNNQSRKSHPLEN